MPVYTANQADTGGRRRRASVQPRQQQLLQHQRHAAGAAVLQGAARLPVAVHHAGHVPQADRVAVAGTSTSTATTGSRTTTSSSSTGTRPPRRWAAPASTTTCSARSTGCMFQDVAGLQPRLDDVVELWPDRHGLRPLHGQQPELPRHAASRSCGRSRAARRYYPLAPGGLLALRRRPARVHRRRPRARDVELRDRARRGARRQRDARQLQRPARRSPRPTDVSLSDNAAHGRHLPEGRRRPQPARPAG